MEATWPLPGLENLKEGCVGMVVWMRGEELLVLVLPAVPDAVPGTSRPQEGATGAQVLPTGSWSRSAPHAPGHSPRCQLLPNRQGPGDPAGLSAGDWESPDIWQQASWLMLLRTIIACSLFSF